MAFLSHCIILGHINQGGYFESSVRFKCSFSNNKAGFYRSFNAIFGKIGRCASEEVVSALIKTKCLPVLLYGTEVCPTNAADLQSMQFTVNRVSIKLFGTMSQNYYQEVSNYFGINTVKELIHNRFEKFRISYGAANNYLCRLIFARCWTYSDCIVYIFFLFFFVSFLGYRFLTVK